MNVRWFGSLLIASLCVASAAHAATASLDAQMPRYAHIFVIVEENKNYGQIVGNGDAPALSRLAAEYGNATDFFAETHPSEANYVAMIGGYTYGIRDDDAYYCVPYDRRPSCPSSNVPGYVSHTIDAPSLATQLEAAGLTWKNYLESIPQPGSLVSSAGFYAAKHSGFMNFLSVQRDPHRAEHIVGFDELYADLQSGNVPNFAFVIPNVCNEMHGAGSPGAPEDCRQRAFHALVRRGDTSVDAIVQRIMNSSAWRSPQNAAIVVTWDENDAYTYIGCCGNDPNDPSNRGGGHIATIIITNHGPRHAVDPTPYSHYSLLRTIEDAFGMHAYLRQAGAPGVVPMLPLFRATVGS